jgi:hypothetical protein
LRLIQHVTVPEPEPINDVSANAYAYACNAYACNAYAYPYAYATVPHYLQPPAFSSIKPLFICLFQIRMDGLDPFLCFLLHRRNGVADFTPLPSFDGGKNNKRLKKEAVDFMQTELAAGEISYAGFAETRERNILILKYVNDEPLPLANAYAWALTHELVNTQTLMADRIHPHVVTFFRQQPAFLALHNQADAPYAAPVVGYYSVPPATKFELADIYRESILPALGKCYYFYIDKKKTADSLTMRAALFLKRTCLHAEQFEANDSLLTIDIEDHHRYVLQNYAQHTPLSVE